MNGKYVKSKEFAVKIFLNKEYYDQEENKMLKLDQELVKLGKRCKLTFLYMKAVCFVHLTKTA